MVFSKWDDAQAAKCDGDLLALRVYTSRLMSESCLPPAHPPLHASGCIPACRKIHVHAPQNVWRRYLMQTCIGLGPVLVRTLVVP